MSLTDPKNRSHLFLKRSTTIIKSNIDLDHTKHLKSETDDNIRLLLCNLCKNVLMRPLTCSGCGGTSCEACIDEWGRNHPRCPNGCKDFKYTQIAKSFNKSLKKLKIKCENHLNGCDAILEYDDVEHHHGVCQYAVVHCKNEGCNAELMRPEMEEHEEHCLFERSLCENCQSIIVKGDRINHNCITVINNKISKLESLVKEIAKKLEDPKEDSFDERKGTMCFRHEFIQDYSLEFSIYHPSVNHYQITLPVQSLLVTPEAR